MLYEKRSADTSVDCGIWQSYFELRTVSGYAVHKGPRLALLPNKIKIVSEAIVYKSIKSNFVFLYPY